MEQDGPNGGSSCAVQRVNNANNSRQGMRQLTRIQAICRLFAGYLQAISSRVQAMTGTAMSANVELLVSS